MATVKANGSGESTSVGMSTRVPESEAALPDLAQTDVCVVGAGIAGLSAAYELTLRGLRVLVLDNGPIGGGETARTTAHLASALDDRFVELTRLHGERGAQLAAQSHASAVTRIETIAVAEQFECDFRRVRGYLFQKAGDDPKDLVVELSAARRAGLAGAQLVERAPIHGFDTGPAVMFPDQGEFNPLAYVSGLARAIERRGGLIVSGVHVTRVDDGPRPKVVTADGHVIEASFVVVATNAPINSLAELPLKQHAYRSYAVALSIPNGSVPHALYWDTEDPYHYVRVVTDPRSKLDFLVVGGEDHRTGQETDDDAAHRYQRLIDWASVRFPTAGEATAKWSGQVLEPIDGLAFIGLCPGNTNTYLITGDSGHGMTHGVVGGVLCADLITGQPNALAALYSPSRRTLRALGNFLKKTVNTSAQYADWFTPGDVSSTDTIPVNGGAVIRRGMAKLAVYRDEAGRCHERSAVCPHLGGIVAWNDAEKSWDCPCHGSRFDALGRVIAGPAVDDLTSTEGGEDAGTPESGDRRTNPWLEREGA